MVYDGIIEGKYVNLRSVSVEDAEFTLKIRQDPEFTQYLPPINITLEQQCQWISKQREKKDDYFFVVLDKAGNKIGTLGVYDISDNTAEMGRLTMKGNPLQSIEAQLLVFDFGFNYLDLDKVLSFVYAENKTALRFTSQFGAIQSESPEEIKGKLEYRFTNTKELFKKSSDRLKRFIYR